MGWIELLGSFPIGSDGQSCCPLGPTESIEGSNLQELGPSTEEANPANQGTEWESIRAHGSGKVSQGALPPCSLALEVRFQLTVVADAECGLCAGRLRPTAPNPTVARFRKAVWS